MVDPVLFIGGCQGFMCQLQNESSFEIKTLRARDVQLGQIILVIPGLLIAAAALIL